ncbi:MAG: hypothetical protein AB1758_00555, partial [Candidatus Eremiobacterota bacterium]
MWFGATGLVLAAAWSVFFYLRQREAYLQSVLHVLSATSELEDFQEQAKVLCEQILAETGAAGASLYLQPGQDESGFRRAALAGRSAE